MANLLITDRKNKGKNARYFLCNKQFHQCTVTHNKRYDIACYINTKLIYTIFCFIPDYYVCNVDQDPKFAKVSKFDSKYLTDDIFARKVPSKVDVEVIPHGEEEQDIVEVFAIDKKEPPDWYRAREVIPRPSNAIFDLSDVIVKTEPGEAPSHEIVDNHSSNGFAVLSDVIVKTEPGKDTIHDIVDLSDAIVQIEPGEGCRGGKEVMVKVEPGVLGTRDVVGSEVTYVGSSMSGLPTTDTTRQKRDMMNSLLNAKLALEKSLASGKSRSSLKFVLNDKLAKEVSLSRCKEMDKYCQDLSSSDMTDYLTWDDGETTPKNGDYGNIGDPDVFCTPTKRTQGPNEFCTPTKKISFNTGPLTPTTGDDWTDTLPIVGERDNNDIGFDVRPQTREKLLLKKKKQMEEKTKWAVANALKQSRTV